MKLNARTTASAGLPEGKTDHIFWDADLTGFGLRVRLGGDRVRKTFIAQYRANGRTRRVLIGSAEKLGAEQARGAAKKVLGKAAIGEDPQAERLARRQREAHTMRSVVQDYLAAKKSSVRFNTYRGLQLYLTGPAFKPLHAMPIDQITRRDVASSVTKITAESGGTSAARARAALSALFAWAMGQGIAEQNPVVGTNKPDESRPRERVLSRAEIAAIWRACGEADAFGRIVKLLLITGCRRMEVCGMRWSEIDAESGVWRLPPERTKNKRAHTLPLPPMAVEIIESVPRIVGRDNLFGERSDLGFTQWGAKADLDARLNGAVKPWKLHDLRRTAATGMADIGVQPHIIEAVLNHISGHKVGVAGIYNRSSYEREVRAALALWAEHIRTIVEGGERKVLAFVQNATEGA
jgi:integrase